MVQLKAKVEVPIGGNMPLNFKPLFHYLLEHDMEIGDLAKKAGVSRSTIWKMKTGQHVSTRIVEKICVALDLEVTQVLEFKKADPQ